MLPLSASRARDVKADLVRKIAHGWFGKLELGRSMAINPHTCADYDRTSKPGVHTSPASTQVCFGLTSYCSLSCPHPRPDGFAKRTQTTSSSAISKQRRPGDQPENAAASTQGLGDTQPDLLYLHILNDAVDNTPGSHRNPPASPESSRTQPRQSLTPRDCLSAKLLQLDEIDREYLVRKGVFELPPQPYLYGAQQTLVMCVADQEDRDVLVKAYFDRVHPLIPVIDRADFIRRYQTRDCSLLLLLVILTTISPYAPADVLSACNFASPSAAQDSFFGKAKRLYDFTAIDDTLSLLQASIIMCTVILARHTDHDFGYWLHNAVSLATKLNLRHMYGCSHRTQRIVHKLTSIKSVLVGNKPPGELKSFRRIWWTLRVS
jgi:hypothetical protein